MTRPLTTRPGQTPSLSGKLHPPAADSHAMLSATHSDSVAAAVVQGGLQIGNATPAWDLLTVGAANTFLRSDGTDVAWNATVVTADANLTDDALVRGKGGARGAQTSLAILSDAGALSGLTQLDVDNLRLDGNTISATAIGSIILDPFADGGVRTLLAGTVEANDYAWSVENSGWHAAMTDTRTSIGFFQAWHTDGHLSEAARITAGTETNWGVAATRDAYLAFFTGLDGTAAEKMRITSTGRIGINTTDPVGLGSAHIYLAAHKDANYMNFAMSCASNNAAHRATMYFSRAGGTEAIKAVVPAGATLGMLLCAGYDGAAYRYPALVKFVVDGAVAANTVPTAITFETGAPARVERLRIQSDGDILVDTDIKMMFRDSGLYLTSPFDGQLDAVADVKLLFSSATIQLQASTAVLISGSDGLNFLPGLDADVDLLTVNVTGAPRQWWDESENAFAMTHRLMLPEGVQTKYATDDVADPPTDAQLDTAFGDPTVVGSGFVGILDDNDAGTDCYICWTTGTAGEWFYVKGTKAV